MKTEVSLIDLQALGEIKSITKDYTPESGDRIFYEVGKYHNSIKGTYWDESSQQRKRIHKWTDWRYSGFCNEVSFEFWNKYSNDDVVTEEEIKHHKFFVLQQH